MASFDKTNLKSFYYGSYIGMDGDTISSPNVSKIRIDLGDDFKLPKSLKVSVEDMRYFFCIRTFIFTGDDAEKCDATIEILLKESIDGGGKSDHIILSENQLEHKGVKREVKSLALHILDTDWKGLKAEHKINVTAALKKMSRVWSIIEWTKSEKDSKKKFKKYKEVWSSSSKGTSSSALRNPTQKIVHGAPGTGKSYNLEKELENDHKIIRTVFHPETTHADFFGSYKPSTVQSVDNAKYESVSGLENLKSSPHIIYTFSPGPLMRAVKRALENPEARVALIIEEINRAHAAAVFGEIFQLLDRNERGISKYPIVISRDAWLYLNPDKDTANSSPEMVLPSNLSLYATMNAADQGVYPMDTAFKRRWTFEHLPIDGTSEATWKRDEWNPSVPILDGHKWQDFRQNLNAWLSRDSKAKLETSIPEDKLLGPYFLNENDLKDPDKAIIEKVLFYIQFDVLRYEPTALFEASQTMSSLRDLADKENLWGVFQTDFRGLFSAKADEPSPPKVQE